MKFRTVRRNPIILSQCDFFEGLNVCEKMYANKLAQTMAEKYGIPCLGGSDSHKSDYVGMAYTDFPGPVTCNNDIIKYVKKGVIDFGGDERAYLKKHHKRNTFYATWSFRLYNTGLGIAETPVRSFLFHQAFKNNSQK